jgi:radical SAM superfamily enzyme YgiQ (UPF0313 family)
MREKATKRIALIAPPYSHTPGPFERFTRFAEPPLGLAGLASYVKSQASDVDVRIIDAPAEVITEQQIIRRIIAQKPTFVGISVATQTAPVTKRICQTIRRALPDCTLIVGGPHPSAMPEDLLPHADIAVIGEGEETLTEIISVKSKADILGIAWSEEGVVVRNSPRPRKKNIDALANPAYELLPMDRYRYPYPFRVSPGRYATAMTSRGCVGRCSFCSKPSIWGDGIRLQSVDRVMENLEYLVNKQNVSLLYFYDDSLLSYSERAIEITELINEKRWPLKWMCQARPDEPDLALCNKLAASGCVQVEIGVESGDFALRTESCKQIENGRVIESFKAVHQAGMQTKANFMFGFPKETENTIASTISFAQELAPTYANFFHLVPLPGSDYYDLYKTKNWIVAQGWESYGYHGKAVVSVPGANADALDQAKRSALLRFYLRPGKVFQMLRILIESRDPATLVRGLFGLINGVIVGLFNRK